MAFYPNRQQWYVLFAAYVGIVVAYGETLLYRSQNLIVVILLGAALLTWRLTRPVHTEGVGGRVLRVGKAAAKAGAVVVVALVVISFVGALLQPPKATPPPQAPPQAVIELDQLLRSYNAFEPDDPAPVATMSASQLVAAYTQNKFDARMKYGFRWVRVTGEIRDMELDDFSTANLTLAIPDKIEGLRARLANPTRLDNVSKGKSVVLKCRPAEPNFKEVVLAHCYVVE